MSLVPEKDNVKEKQFDELWLCFSPTEKLSNTICIWKVIPFVQHNAELKAKEKEKKRKKPSTINRNC